MIEQSETIGGLAAALAKAQANMQAAAKDSINPHFKSKYADLASVWEACRAALSSNGLSVAQVPLSDTETGEVRLMTVLLHSSGEWLRGSFGARPRDLSPQSVGSCLTYLRRYSLAAMVGVVADEDDDANHAQPPRAAAKAAPTKPAPSASPATQPCPTAEDLPDTVEKPRSLKMQFWDALQEKEKKGEVATADKKGLGDFWSICESQQITVERAVMFAVGATVVTGNSPETNWKEAAQTLRDWLARQAKEA